ncbi:MAG: S9 family peptidase [Algicola sp.]|nr:S9 family peptidase [Algicola sp.]
MTRMPNFVFILAMSLIAMFATHQAMAQGQLIPLEHFNQMPMVQMPAISPDGKNIAVIVNQGEFTQVALIPFENARKMTYVLKLGAEKYRIDNLAWANNERVLVTVSQPFAMQGMRYRTSHIYSAKLDGSSVLELRRKTRKETQLTFYFNSPNLLSLLEEDSDHILVTIQDPRDNNYSSVFKVNVNNGDYEKYLPNSKRIVDWGVTSKGEVLLAIGVDKDYKKGVSYIYTRKDSDADWKLVKTLEDYKSETFSVELYDEINNTIIITSDHRTKKGDVIKQRLWRYEINSGKYQLLADAPDDYDVTGAITRLQGTRRDLIGYTYNDGFERFVYFDKDSDLLAQEIRGIFAKNGLQAGLYDWDSTKQRYIISTLSDTKPAKFYLFDKKANKLSPWYGQYPHLEKAAMAKVQPFMFEARDGMVLHGYLTLPNGVKNPPVVLYPHGGPFARDSQYFDPFVQMFASRGFAVVQVNFRGSTGYGNVYQTSGYKQWGKKMQTDLLDAMDWLKQSGQANTDKACIVGASYGGYAALVAGYQTPNKFKCIVSIAGISDIQGQINHWKRRGSYSYVRNAVSEDAKDIEAISPLKHVNAFKAPVLLIHGKVDLRVSYRQSEQMFDALEDAGKKVEIELFDFGTHNLDDAANRKKAMELMDAFLRKYLK